MSLILFQENVILSLFRDLFLIEPSESGTHQQMTLNFHATFRSANSNPIDHTFYGFTGVITPGGMLGEHEKSL